MTLILSKHRVVLPQMPNVVGAPRLPVPQRLPKSAPLSPAGETGSRDLNLSTSGELACSGAAMAGGALLLASLAAAQAYGS